MLNISSLIKARCNFLLSATSLARMHYCLYHMHLHMGGDIQAGVIIRDVVVLIMAGSYFYYCPKELRTMNYIKLSVPY